MLSLARPHLRAHRTAQTPQPVLVCTLHHLLRSQAQLLSQLQLLLLASLQGHSTAQTGWPVRLQPNSCRALCV
jgi:hypothetical protein